MSVFEEGFAREFTRCPRPTPGATPAEAGERPEREVGARLSTKTRKSARTRVRIMEAASRLMVERGTTSFHMSEVADLCEMSKGSLYYYFADREGLIAAIFDELFEELVASIEELCAHASTAREALSGLYMEFSRRLRSGSPLSLAFSFQLGSTTSSRMPDLSSGFSRATKLIAEQLERGKAEGIVRDDVDCATAAAFSLGGVVATSATLSRTRTADGADDSEDTAARLLEMILRGIGADGASL